jgi:hypothetical protein
VGALEQIEEKKIFSVNGEKEEDWVLRDNCECDSGKRCRLGEESHLVFSWKLQQRLMPSFIIRHSSYLVIFDIFSEIENTFLIPELFGHFKKIFLTI